MEVKKEELQRRVAKCIVFLNVASVLDHEIVSITSTPPSIYSSCAGVF